MFCLCWFLTSLENHSSLVGSSLDCAHFCFGYGLAWCAKLEFVEGNMSEWSKVKSISCWRRKVAWWCSKRESFSKRCCSHPQFSYLAILNSVLLFNWCKQGSILYFLNICLIVFIIRLQWHLLWWVYARLGLFNDLTIAAYALVYCSQWTLNMYFNNVNNRTRIKH